MENNLVATPPPCGRVEYHFKIREDNVFRDGADDRRARRGLDNAQRMRWAFLSAVPFGGKSLLA